MSSTCTFCKIVQQNAPAVIQHESEEILIFDDIKPASQHHFLVIPKKHILNAKHLTPDDKPLVDNLIESGQNILKEKGLGLDDAVFGFHWPPFNSVQHLHLHVIAPASQMSFLSRQIFKPDSFWFVTPKYVLERISPKSSHL